MTKPSEILRAARKRIELEENWCKKAAARNDKGRKVALHSKRASAWCAIGAINENEIVVRHTALFSDAYKYLESEIGRGFDFGDGPIVGFNDAPTTTHEMVMQKFSDAIARLESEGR